MSGFGEPTGNTGRGLQATLWFEEMIEGSELGKIRRVRGGRSSLGGGGRVEWEILDFGDDEEEDRVQSIGKRKLDMVGKGDDVELRGGF